MMGRIAVTGLAVAVCSLGGLAGATGAAAEEMRQQLNAPMILNLLARPPLESSEAAFNKELKNYAAPPKGDDAGTKNLTLTIKNPCPPGDIEHEMAQLSPYRQLPGRARR